MPLPKDGVTYQTGICSGCQSEVYLTRTTDFTEDDILMYGKESRWVVIEHKFYGQPCTGVGTNPEVLTNDY